MPKKAKAPVPVYYWDACVFLSYINKRADRFPNISALLEEAERGEIQIVTSVITISEVAWAAVEQMGHPLDTEVEKKIDALWTPPSPVGMIAYYRQMVRERSS